MDFSEESPSLKELIFLPHLWVKQSNAFKIFLMPCGKKKKHHSFSTRLNNMIFWACTGLLQVSLSHPLLQPSLPSPSCRAAATLHKPQVPKATPPAQALDDLTAPDGSQVQCTGCTGSGGTQTNPFCSAIPNISASCILVHLLTDRTQVHKLFPVITLVWSHNTRHLFTEHCVCSSKGSFDPCRIINIRCRTPKPMPWAYITQITHKLHCPFS